MSSKTMFFPEATKEIIFCPSCGDPFRGHPAGRIPLILPCSHHICRDCINGLLTAEETTCPVCQVDHENKLVTNIALADFCEESYINAMVEHYENTKEDLPAEVREAIALKRQKRIPAANICNDHQEEETSLWCIEESRKMCRLCSITEGTTVKPITECTAEIEAAKALYLQEMEATRLRNIKMFDDAQRIEAFAKKRNEEVMAAVQAEYDRIVQIITSQDEYIKEKSVEVDAEIARIMAAPDYNPRIIPLKQITIDEAAINKLLDNFKNMVQDVVLSIDEEGNIVETVVEKPEATVDEAMVGSEGEAGAGEVSGTAIAVGGAGGD